MEIHLVRHTPVENPEGLCYGFSDISLRPNFLEDFKKVKLDSNYDEVISSPSQRCQLLAQFFKFKYKIDDRLREMNFGDWELKKWTEILQHEIEPWYNDFVNYPTKNGENLLQMQARVLDFWSELLSNNQSKKIVIITHAGVIRLILQNILQFPLENMFNLHIDYGKKTIIRIDNQIVSIKSLNI